MYVPRFFTFTDLINFISNKTNIASDELILFEYFPNHKENLFKRSDFLLKKINEIDYDIFIDYYTKNNKNNFPILFLFVKNKEKKIFKNKKNINNKLNVNTNNYETNKTNQNFEKENFIEDFNVNSIKNMNSGIIHIPYKMNFLEFKKNFISIDEIDNEIFLKNSEKNYDNQYEVLENIIFLKLLLPNYLFIDDNDENKNTNLDCYKNDKKRIKNENENNDFNTIDELTLRIIDVFTFYIIKEKDFSSEIFINLKCKVKESITNFVLKCCIENKNLGNFINNNILKELEKTNFSFITERTCLFDITNTYNSNYNITENLFEDITSENILNFFEKNKGIILIPKIDYEKINQTIINENERKDKKKIECLNDKNIKIYIKNLFNIIYIDLFCLNSNLSLYDKMKFDIREIQDEKSIKEKILLKIKNKKIFDKIFQIQNHFIITANQETLSCRDFFEKIDLNYFDIINNRDTNGKTTNMYKETPISRFINHIDMRIDLSFSYLNKQNNSEFKNFDLGLFDNYSNKIAFLSCAIPRKLKRAKEIIEFISKSDKLNIIFDEYNNDFLGNNILNNLNKNKNLVKGNISKINPNNCFFILVHPKDCFIYHFIHDENSEIFKFEAKAEFKYRLQIYEESFINKIRNINIYSKIYVKINLFGYEEIKIDPFILYMEKIQTNFDLKLEVNRSLINSRNLNKAVNPNYSNFEEFLQNEKNLEKIKYFKSKVSAGNFKKISNINNYKEDDIIETIFKGDRIYNLLVEISLNNR